MSHFVIVSRKYVLNNEKSQKIVDFFMILAILQHFALFTTKAREKCQLKKEEFFNKKEEIMLKRENLDL